MYAPYGAAGRRFRLSAPLGLRRHGSGHPPPETRHPATFWLATLAGPILFNYLPMWIGVMHMRRADAGNRLFGMTLVFATIPIMRIVFSVLHANDEPWIVRQLFGTSATAFWLMNVVIWIFTVPPLLLAWATLPTRNRLGLFLSFLLAMPVFVFYVVGILLENLIVRQHVLSDTVWGMPYLVLLVEALAYLGYHLTRQHLRRDGDGIDRGREHLVV